MAQILRIMNTDQRIMNTDQRIMRQMGDVGMHGRNSSKKWESLV